jgi:tetratricopeptide (TPR) repeat protein
MKNQINYNSLKRIFIFFSFLAFCQISINAQSSRDKKLTNLKILPQDISGQELRNVMQGFSSALGVHCEYCHYEEENDFASDGMPAKQIARVMMKMKSGINDTFLKEARTINKDIAGLNCVSCHHGSPKIRLLEDVLYDTYQKKGIDSSIVQYNTLRKNYYGAAIYDFREMSLINYSHKLITDKKFDDAVFVLKKNLEFFPQSTRTFNSFANLYNDKGEKDNAVAYLQKSLAVDPGNRYAKQMLERINAKK